MAEMARGQREGGNMRRTTDKQLIRHTSPQKRKTLPPQISHRDRIPAHEKPTEGATKARNERITQSRGSAGKPAKHGPYEISRPQPTTVPTAHPDRPAARNVKWERSRAMALGRKARREENGGVPT
ncbi:hypothetical protein SISNIDRAFT_469124 [Sistotremastrum niveocremeum HHB9708]|uniref:Uncharacterized protein n=1 Tax=Sistotremastrum niveocremeum HHB9708 TaxID=1314777 RepID=A0A164QFB7_9AGAM|nr:hypothetical protein SISNIDRAFT_469124 [Sistotremastrum niveocremeum HHB9708]